MNNHDNEKTIDVEALYNPIYLAVGKGISSFSQLESQLAMIFAHLMRPAEIKTSLTAFDEIRLTSPKIRVLKAVAKRTLDQDKLEKLSVICKRVEARADFRTKLAHWIVSLWHPDGLPLEDYDKEVSAALVPPWFSQNNLYFDASEAIGVTEINEFAVKCSEITGDLVRFNLMLQGIE